LLESPAILLHGGSYSLGAALVSGFHRRRDWFISFTIWIVRGNMGRVLHALAIAAALILQSVPAHAITCVAYVRAVSGFDLSGNAWQWWGAAAGVYNRGHVPEPGAVVVFSRTRQMRDGHVALVREVLGSREILIDQANWEVVHHHRGAVSKAVHVIDASPDNDWSVVRVQWGRADVFGRTNPVSGFIYPDADSHANVSRARYLEARMQAAENRDPSSVEAENAAFVEPVSRAHHHRQLRCAVVPHGNARHHAHAKMVSWRVASLAGRVGAERPR
jgi:surface antigen